MNSYRENDFRAGAPRAGAPTRATRIALAVVATLGASAAVQADPLSLVQSLRDGEDGTTLPGARYGVEVFDDQVYVLTGDLFQLFGRDPATGSLTLLDSVVDWDRTAEPAAGDVSLFESFDVLPDGLLLVSGGERGPDLCNVAPGCSIIGTVTFSTDGGQFSLESSSSDGDGGNNRLTVSPDGRHAYALQRGLTIYSVSPDGQTDVVGLVGDDFRLDGTSGIATQMAFTPDSRMAFVRSLGIGGSGERITVMSRDAARGQLTAVDEIDPSTEPGDLVRLERLEVSPDGTSLYAPTGSSSSDDLPGGLVRYAIDADGSLEQVAIDRSANDAVPASLDFPREIAISPNGRLVLVANSIGSNDSQQSLHLFTVGDDGVTTWRGFEQSNGGGVGNDDLRLISDVTFSTDGASAYVMSGNAGRNVLSTFAAHADSVTTIAVPAKAALAGDAVTATVRVFNAGPATAHGLVATVEASGPIASTDRPDDCTVRGAEAVCRIDEIDAMGTADIVVTAAAPMTGELTLSVVTTQYQTDLDESSNTATATVPVVTEADQVDSASVPSTSGGDEGTGGNGGTGGAAGDSDSSGGGCSIASTGARDPSLALLVLAGLFGMRARRRVCADYLARRGYRIG